MEPCLDSNLEKFDDNKSLNDHEMAESDLLSDLSTANKNVIDEASPHKETSGEEIKNEMSNNLNEESSNSINSKVENPLDTESNSKEEEWLDIMGSGNFMKKVLKKGLGHETRPDRGDLITASVVFSLNDVVFEHRENLQFITGDLDVIQGLDLVVCLMEKGEKAVVKIPSKLAYGKHGRLPHVPPDSDIECEIEIKDIESVDQSKLTISRRLDLGNEKRERGNFFYERAEFLDAIHCYERASAYLDGIKDSSGSSAQESQDILDLRIKVYNNTAAAHLKLDAYDKAMTSVENVLRFQPQNVKALFRKSRILAAKGNTDEAIACIKTVAKLQPDEKLFQSQLTKLLNKKKREEHSQKAMYKRMFPDTQAKKSKSFSKFLKWSALTGGVLAVAAGVAFYRQLHF